MNGTIACEESRVCNDKKVIVTLNNLLDEGNDFDKGYVFERQGYTLRTRFEKRLNTYRSHGVVGLDFS